MSVNLSTSPAPRAVINSFAAFSGDCPSKNKTIGITITPSKPIAMIGLNRNPPADRFFIFLFHECGPGPHRLVGIDNPLPIYATNRDDPREFVAIGKTE